MNTTSDDFDTPALIPVRKMSEGPPRHVSAADLVDACNRALDAAGRPFASIATTWCAAARKRDEARTEDALKALREANRAHRDALRDLRRDQKSVAAARKEAPAWRLWNRETWAARAVVRDSRALVSEARTAKYEARSAYPLTLPGLAFRCHAAHLIPATLWAWMGEGLQYGVPFTLSVTGIAFNVMAVALGRRHVTEHVADPELDALRPSQEERDLLKRLDPKTWHRVAEPRGLADVLVADARLTDSGIQAKLTLNGTLDLSALQGKQAQLRAALRLKEGIRLELREGHTGGHARLTLRTRSAADGLDMTGWKPGDAWAVNTVTGETVAVPLGKRLLVAGTSGSGKSWSARPLMAEASEWEDHRLVIFDRKHIEGRNWEHRARIVTELDEMMQLVDELIEEGEERLQLIPRGRDVVQISPSRPRITVFVDEGGELISDCVKEFERIIDALRTVARKYRAAEIILVWATQKPSMSGKGYGIDSQIAGQMTDRLSLAVGTATEARVVFGEDAAERGWKSNELPMPGFALYRQQDLGPKSVPYMLKMRAMSPAQVIALPDRPVWSRTVSSTGVTASDIEARKALETAGRAERAASRKGKVSAADRDDQIMAALRSDPCRSISSLASEVGASKSVVSKRLAQMQSDGLVRQDDDRCWHPVF